MLERMDFMMISAKNRMGKYLERVANEEDGSVMIEIILLIVVLIVVAGVFQKQLSGAVEAVFKKLTNFINS